MLVIVGENRLISGKNMTTYKDQLKQLDHHPSQKTVNF